MTGSLPRKVALAAGGTGGHLFPAQALARELLARDIEVLLITDHRGSGFGPELPQVETVAITAGGIAGIGLVRRLRNAAKLAMGYLQARGHLRRSGADCVVGFGGYPSLPPVLAGAHLGLRIVLHEQNAVMGRANRFLASRADAICTSFRHVESFGSALESKVTVTGNPVRATILEVGRRPFAVPNEGDALRLLVVGGSQGALAFNELVPAAVAQLPENLRWRLTVQQQVPGQAVREIAQRYDEIAVAHELAPFFADIPERLARSHLILARAGASTVAELAAAGRPAIMVPFPSATDDHQTHNAQALSDVGGGWLMPQNSLTVEGLAERLASLLSDPALLARAAGCAKTAAFPEAGARLAAVVCGEASANGDRNDEEVAA